MHGLLKLKHGFQSAYCVRNKHDFESGVNMLNPGITSGDMVYLDHSNTQYMHLGDLLFFLDIVQLCNHSGIGITLVGSNQLEWFFHQYGVHYAPAFERVNQPGIILTKSDQLYALKKYHLHTIIGFNFWRVTGQGPIAALICRVFARYMHQYHPNHPLNQPKTRLKAPLITPGPNLRFSKPIMVVNSFVASQQWQHYMQLPALNQWVYELRKLHAIQTVCVGSKKDRLKHIGYPVDRDLRGELSIEELMVLLRSNDVKCVVTFDTFIAHLATLLQIPVYVVVKSRWKKQLIRSRFVPFFQSNSPVEFR